MMQRVLLQSANQIGNLIERSITAVERPAHFRRRIVALVAHSIDEKVDAFLWGHLLQMKAERKDDARATVHAPEKGTDFVLRPGLKMQIPEHQLPLKRAP